MFLGGPYKRFKNDYSVYMFSRKNVMGEGYTIQDMANDQVSALKELGIETARILGVSQGGMIAQCIAIQYPAVCDKLILAVTAPNANETMTSVIEQRISLAEAGKHSELMMDTAERMYSASYLNSFRRALLLISKLTKPSGYDRFLINARAILQFDVRDQLSSIYCPTLIIAGERDQIAGNDAAELLKQANSGSELYVYQGLGHDAFEEAKDFYERVLEFCDARKTQE